MRLELEHRVPGSLPLVFAFHADPTNLALLLRGWPGFTLLRHAGDVAPGSETWVEQRLGGVVPVVACFRHTRCEPPTGFTEELVHGPFRRFVHAHEFASDGDSVLVRDRLEVELSWCYGGEPALRVLLRPWLERFFAFRHDALNRLARQGSFASRAGGRRGA